MHTSVAGQHFVYHFPWPSLYCAIRLAAVLNGTGWFGTTVISARSWCVITGLENREAVMATCTSLNLSAGKHIYSINGNNQNIYYIYILYRYIGINAKIIGPTYLHTLLIMGAFVPASVFVFLFVEWYMWNVGENVSDGMCPYPQHFWSDSSFCGVQLYLVGCGCRDEDPRVA